MFSADGLQELGHAFHIVALVEAGIGERTIAEVGKAEELNGAELAVVAQTGLQAVVAIDTCRGLAVLLYEGGDVSHVTSSDFVT